MRYGSVIFGILLNNYRAVLWEIESNSYDEMREIIQSKSKFLDRLINTGKIDYFTVKY